MTVCSDRPRMRAALASGWRFHIRMRARVTQLSITIGNDTAIV
jgi:hypothetical protein